MGKSLPRGFESLLLRLIRKICRGPSLSCSSCSHRRRSANDRQTSWGGRIPEVLDATSQGDSVRTRDDSAEARLAWRSAIDGRRRSTRRYRPDRCARLAARASCASARGNSATRGRRSRAARSNDPAPARCPRCGRPTSVGSSVCKPALSACDARRARLCRPSTRRRLRRLPSRCPTAPRWTPTWLATCARR